MAYIIIKSHFNSNFCSGALDQNRKLSLFCFLKLTGIKFSITAQLLIDSLLTPIVESTYLNRDMCKFESSQKDESGWQSTDSSKAYRNTNALSVSITALLFSFCIIISHINLSTWNCYNTKIPRKARGLDWTPSRAELVDCCFTYIAHGPPKIILWTPSWEPLG